jgi:hypothetical protein
MRSTGQESAENLRPDRGHGQFNSRLVNKAETIPGVRTTTNAPSDVCGWIDLIYPFSASHGNAQNSAGMENANASGARTLNIRYLRQLSR